MEVIIDGIANDHEMPSDPDPDAGRRVFREWMEHVADVLSESEGVEWDDAFNVVVDIVDSTPDSFSEEVLVTAARRYLRLRYAPDGPSPGEILRQVRAELEP